MCPRFARSAASSSGEAHWTAVGVSAGHRLDTESGLYYTLHRHYHPTLGRWLQRDPEGYVDGMGLYEYCRGNVGNGLDPYGLDRLQWEGKPEDVSRAKKNWDKAKQQAKGPMKQKMDEMDNDKGKTTRIKVVSGEEGKGVIVGGFPSGRLDIDDIDAFPDKGPSTKASKTAHEVVEQHAKQCEGKKDYINHAHPDGVAAEEAVSGWKRGPLSSDKASELPDGKVRVEILFGRESPNAPKNANKGAVEYRKVTYETDSQGRVVSVKDDPYNPPAQIQRPDNNDKNKESLRGNDR